LTFAASAGEVSRVAFSPDGAHLVTASAGGTQVWNARTGQRELLIPGGGSGAAYSSDGETIITSGGPPQRWNATTGRPVWSSTETDWFPSIAVSPSGDRVAAGREDGFVEVLDGSTGKVLDTFDAAAELVAIPTVQGLAFSPDGTLLATASWNHTAKIWDLATGGILHTFTGASRMQSVEFSPDGTMLAAANWDGTARIWNVSTGALVRTFSGHVGVVEDATFSPDGTRLATAGDDNTVRLWNVATGIEILTLPGHTSAVTDVAFSPDGTELVSSGRDGTVREYVLPIDRLMTIAQQRLTRGFSPDECRRYLHVSACPRTPGGSSG
jgi:WD40 repeat protein